MQVVGTHVQLHSPAVHTSEASYMSATAYQRLPLTNAPAAHASKATHMLLPTTHAAQFQTGCGPVAGHGLRLGMILGNSISLHFHSLKKVPFKKLLWDNL